MRVIRGDPNVYEIEDLEGEPIIGKFYEEELSAVNKRDDVYKVEKILKGIGNENFYSLYQFDIPTEYLIFGFRVSIGLHC